MPVRPLSATLLLSACAATAFLAGCAARAVGPPASVDAVPTGPEQSALRPAKVTVDGEEIKLVHGLAVGWGRRRYAVSLFNHDKVTCEQMLAPSRLVAEGEIEVRASGSAEGGFGDGLAIHEFTRLDVEVKLAQEPREVGDTVGVDVPKPKELVPTIGVLKGKSVVISGLFQGKFCGERK